MISAMAGNFLAASAQIAIVVSIAAVALWALRLRTPGVRHAYWRIVAVLCLALPWMQPHVALRSGSVALVQSAVVTNATASTASPSSGADPVVVAVVVLAAGALLRLAWLGAGLRRLRQLRHRAALEPRFADADDLQRTLGTAADVRFTAGLAHPVTFGLFAPVVLLPASLQSQPPEIQRAVVGHELIHVQRRDWGWLIAEEIAVCFAWFHPAAWWLASRIQLTREEVVDELAVLLTGRRKAYVEALLAFSDSMSVVPTAAFAKRRHLFRRIALVAKEDVMSSTRIVTSCAAMAAIVLGGSWYAASAFPLRASVASFAQLPTGSGPLERRARPVTPENPIPRRIHFEPPVMPVGTQATGATVVMRVTLDEVGRVTEARATEVVVVSPDFDVNIAGENLKAQLDRDSQSRPPDIAAASRRAVEAFVDAATTSVRAWRYDPPAEGPLAFSVTIRFADAPTKIAPERMVFSAKEPDALRVGGAIKPPVKIKNVPPVYPDDAKAAKVEGVVILEARIGADGSVEAAHVLRSIPMLDQAALDAVRQWQFEPTLMNGQPVPIIMTVTINFTLD